MSTKKIKIWDVVNNVPIIQPMIHQRLNMCAFAAVGRTLDYQLRVVCAKSDPPTRLRKGPLVDYLTWEDELKREFPHHADKWLPCELFCMAEVYGVPLWNGMRHKIEGKNYVPRDNMTPEAIRDILDFPPVTAVFNVRSGFSYDGERPYRGEGKIEEIMMVDGLPRKVSVTHAVVLVGEYRGYANEVMWIYQNSGGNPDRSMMKNGLSLVSHSMIREVYSAWSYPPDLIVPIHLVSEVLAIGNQRFLSRSAVTSDETRSGAGTSQGIENEG